MKSKSIKISAIVLSFLFLIAPMFIFAQTIKNPLGGPQNVEGFISYILQYVVKIGGIVAIFAFIYSGFLFVQAQGNPDGLKKAKDFFYGTCIGVAVL